MDWRSRHVARVGFLVLLVVTTGAVGWSFATADTADGTSSESSLSGLVSSFVGSTTPQPEVRLLGTGQNGSNVSGPLTLVTTQGYYTADGYAQLVALTGTGRAVYRDTTYDAYFDVDPVANASGTVEYVAATHREGDCPTGGVATCTRNVVVRANLTADTERVVYADVTPRIEATRWHDVDRINDTHLAVADIAADAVFVVDVRTDSVVWRWDAASVYDGGDGEADWTHLNDVEVLDDGRIVVSVRNMNQVLFIVPGEGVQTAWTLGEQTDDDVLDEQHNPDYIPPERGGPALVVADSQNNRVVEYQRRNGSWDRSWRFQSSRMQWPRDADRLPNGNTLVTDTNTNRIVEIAPNGTIVWQASVGMPYDVERLGTGDESAGGRSLARLHGASVVEGDDGVVARPERGRFVSAWVWLKDATPSRIANGLLFVAPPWVQFSDLVFGLLSLLGGLCWASAELYWSRYEPSAVFRRLWARFGS